MLENDVRRRIWSEFLPPEELAASATINLLERFGLEPLIALPKSAESPAMARALHRLSLRGIPLGLWPLLDDHEGYWPSEDNASAFLRRCREALAFADAAGARIRTIAIDLEPPLEVMRALAGDSARARMSAIWSGMREARSRSDVRRSANNDFLALSRRLSQDGYETIAAVVPPVVIDLYAQTSALQALFRTPVFQPGWSVISPMVYTTILAQLLPSGRMSSARALMYEVGRGMHQALGPGRCALSLGLVTSGKLGDEPAYASPLELLEDVQAARATGINDLALFALEGVLHRDPPERWLLPFTQACAAPQAPLVGGVMSVLVRTASWAVRLSVGRAPPILR